MAADWAQILPDADYRFHMGLRRGDAAGFYAPTVQRESILEQRRRWIEEGADEYAAIESGGSALLDEAIELAFQWQSVLDSDKASLLSSSHPPSSAEGGAPSRLESKCRELARRWEPDFLLLRPDDQRMFSLAGGSVCFPSSWSLREKLGRPVAAIHGVVPGLNAALEQQIQNFLGRLPPGLSWERENWGMSRTPEWNMHPQRHLPRLKPPLSMNEIWLRVEHQSFVALPRSRGILFGIRLQVHALGEIARDVIAAKGLVRALRTMPEETARYKGLAEAQAELIRLLT